MIDLETYMDELDRCILRRNDTVPAIKPMINTLLKNKLSQCPCSTKYHGAYPGGLVAHSLNVANLALNLAILLGVRDNMSLEQLKLLALIHDLGKLGNLKDDFYLPNPDSNKRDKEPYIVNTKLVSIPHEIRTLYWLDILNIRNLTEAELQAVCYHAGPYSPGYLESVRKESLLLVLLHTADNLSTKVLESEEQK